ncbi:MAG: bacteriohemerythrin [Hydrogenobaculum sp.]
MLLPKERILQVALMEMNDIHFEEIDLLNELYDAIKNNEPTERIEKLFEDFLADVVYHFEFENNAMKETGFFAYPMHRQEHEMRMAELNKLKEDFYTTKNKKLIANYLEQKFIPWLIIHVPTMDTVTAQYLADYL